jgi:hypothetical protein
MGPNALNPSPLALLCVKQLTLELRVEATHFAIHGPYMGVQARDVAARWEVHKMPKCRARTLDRASHAGGETHRHTKRGQERIRSRGRLDMWR